MNLAIAGLGFMSILVSLAEVYCEDVLEDTSARFIQALQTADSIVLVYLFVVLEVVTGGVFMLVCFMIYFWSNRYIGAMGVCIGFMSVFLTSFLKMAFAHPRPLWKYAFIKPIKCPSDYGYPSGHAFNSSSIIYFLMYYWLSSSPSSPFKFLLAGLSMLVVFLDRTYLGVHFYFQVVAGFVYSGFFISIVLHPIVLKYSKKLFRDFKALIYTHLITGILVIIAFILFKYRNSTIKPAWKEIYKNKCHKDLSYEEAILKNFDECTSIVCVIGFCLGYHLSYAVPAAKFNKKTLAIATFLAISLSLGYFTLEKISKSIFSANLNLFIVLLLRYAFTAAASYTIPVALDKCAKKIEEPTVNSNSELTEFKKNNF
jgi:membrane-associated phospholipid phosphatase